mgnify:CR=1 FL=1
MQSYLLQFDNDIDDTKSDVNMDELLCRISKLNSDALAELEETLSDIETFYAERAAYIPERQLERKTIVGVLEPPTIRPFFSIEF